MRRDPYSGLRDLCALCLPAELFVPALLEALHEVVPSSRNLFDWCDEQGRLLRYFIEGPVDAALAKLYFEAFHNRLEADAMAPFQSVRDLPAGVRSADELDHPRFFESALYREIWRPQGFHTRLEAVLRGRRGQLLGSLVLYRAPGDVRFTRQDERRLGQVLPLVAQALEAGGVARPDDRHVRSTEPPQTLLLTLDGELQHASDGAMRLLLLAEGGLSPERLLAPLQRAAGGLLALLLQQLRWSAARHGGRGVDLLAPPPSVTHENAFGQFSATGTLLYPHGQPFGAQPLVQVRLLRLEPHRVALERVLRSLPITAGQRAVCRELYEVQPQAQIAAKLGVAQATVIDHVRKIYRSLDLRSVNELRALIDRRMQAG